MFLKHWQFLRSFFDFAYLRYLLGWFALVPFVLNLLVAIPSEVILFEKYRLNLTLPFTWWTLWIASLAYFIAFSLYHLFCPSFIKRYPSYAAYLTHEHSPRWIVWEFYYALNADKLAETRWGRIIDYFYYLISPLREKDVIYERVITKRYAIATDLKKLPSEKPIVGASATKTYFKYDGKIYELLCDQTEKLVKIREQEIFWEVFGHFAKQGAFVRGVISWLIGISLALVFWTVGEHVYSGFKFIFK